MRSSHRSSRGPRAIAFTAMIALVGVAFAVSAGDRAVRAAASSPTGMVSGTGQIVVGTQTTVVSVSASYDGLTPLTGSASIETHTTGGPQGSPGFSTVTCVAFSGASVVVGGLKDGHIPYLLFITDGGTTSDTLEFTTQYGADCSVGPFGGSGGTVLISGDFTVSPPADSNGDGIVDTLQPNGTPTGSFEDDLSLPKPTIGSIVDAAGLSVSITDARDPLGVVVTVGPGDPLTQQVALSVCPFPVAFPVQLGPDSVTTITCGSVTLMVARGVARVVLGGGITVVSITDGGAAKVADTGGGTFSVANVGVAGSVSLTVDGTTATIPVGVTTAAATSRFLGFTQPVDNAPVLNRVKAGQAIPVKWRLVDSAGTPITNLSSVRIYVTSLDCSLGTTVDQIEEAAAGSSGLQNLGNGYYQLNWKSPKTYAASCKTLHLDISDGVTHDALFQFTK